MGHFVSKRVWKEFVGGVIFMLMFVIAFGEPPVAVLKILSFFQGPFWGHFEHFSADAAKLKNCNLFKRNAWFGRCWASGFASFLLTF